MTLTREVPSIRLDAGRFRKAQFQLCRHVVSLPAIEYSKRRIACFLVHNFLILVQTGFVVEGISQGEPETTSIQEQHGPPRYACRKRDMGGNFVLRYQNSPVLTSADECSNMVRQPRYALELATPPNPKSSFLDRTLSRRRTKFKPLSSPVRR